MPQVPQRGLISLASAARRSEWPLNGKPVEPDTFFQLSNRGRELAIVRIIEKYRFSAQNGQRRGNLSVLLLATFIRLFDGHKHSTLLRREGKQFVFLELLNNGLGDYLMAQG